MKKILCLSFICLLTVALCGQSLLFVSPNGNDSQNGQSWATAKASVGSALAAATNGTTICIQVGQYAIASEMTIPNGVTLKGGFAAGCSGTDTLHHQYPGPNAHWSDTNLVTLLVGSGNHRLFTVQSGGRIASCVLRNGYSTTKGGGLLLNGGTASHCVITECTAHSDSTLAATGGGVYMQNNAQLLNCVVCYNHADNGYGIAGNSGDAINNTITQNSSTNCGTVTDYDGNTYSTAYIGTQCWMREYLRTTHFADGTPIYHNDSLSLYTPLYYNEGSSGQESRTMGYLYNIQAARHGSQEVYSETAPSNVQGICPTGWHLPSNAEFEQLQAYLSGSSAHCCGGQTAQIGKTLASQSYWLSSTNACAVGNNLAANNVSGFNAQPAGYFNGSFSDFYGKACLWTSSRSDNVSSRCVYRCLQYDSSILGSGYYTPDYGCSVRCVKN